jgi:hypothetical protein
MWCGECSRDRTLRDGLPVAHSWDFEARLIAEALIAVGNGDSYRKAAQSMRIAARRFETNNGVVIVSPWGGSVMRYLDHFGQLVLAAVDHQEWPEVLLLDAWPLRKREVRPDDPFSFEQSGSGAVLVAVGYSGIYEQPRRRRRNDEGDLVAQPPRIKRQAHVWKATLSGGYNRWAWADFLASLPGTPRWIVVDGEAPVRLGIKLRWGDGPDAPVVFSCEGHLQRKFRDRALTEDRLAGIEVARLWPEHKPWDPDPAPGPLWSRDHYRRFLDDVLAYPPERVRAITSWIKAHDATIRAQFDLRDEFRGYPRGNGPVEAAIAKIEIAVGERHKQFQNVYRTNLMLELVRAHLGGHDDPAIYTRIVRDELERTNGRPDINWREHHFTGRVRGGQPAPEGSLFHLADHYQRLGERGQRDYWQTKQGSSMEKKLLETNIYHFLNGYPPLRITDSKAPAVVLAGLRLSDFPLIRREWDPDNAEDPNALAATYTGRVNWICSEDPSHRFLATVHWRCLRLTGCQACQKVRGIAAVAKGSRERDGLLRIRAAWGDFDEPLAVRVGVALLDAADAF